MCVDFDPCSCIENYDSSRGVAGWIQCTQGFGTALGADTRAAAAIPPTECAAFGGVPINEPAYCLPDGGGLQLSSAVLPSASQSSDEGVFASALAQGDTVGTEALPGVSVENYGHVLRARAKFTLNPVLCSGRGEHGIRYVGTFQLEDNPASAGRALSLIGSNL